MDANEHKWESEEERDIVAEEATPPLSDEWIAEIQRRSAEFDAGRAVTIPWEQVRAEMRRRAGIDDAH